MRSAHRARTQAMTVSPPRAQVVSPPRAHFQVDHDCLAAAHPGCLAAARPFSSRQHRSQVDNFAVFGNLACHAKFCQVWC